MANEQMPQTYAQAIFEQATGDWLAPLRRVQECLEPAQVEALDNPASPFAKKQELLQQALPAELPQEVRNFVSLLASKNQVHLLPHVIAEFDRYAQRGPVRDIAQVTSAVPLTDGERRSIEDKMRARFGRDTDFDYVVNPEILGGVIVRKGDQVIDGSVAAKLAALRGKLTAG